MILNIRMIKTTYLKTLTPAPAAIMAGTFLVITRQLLELESFLNHLRIPEVFQF